MDAGAAVVVCDGDSDDSDDGGDEPAAFTLDGSGQVVAVADTVLDEINNYLDFDYLAELQAHVDDDDDENKADTVAVAQRVKQWQSSKSARLAEACAHAAGFTGTFNTQSVELWFQQQLAGV